MSAAFSRGKRGNKSIYVPIQSGGLIQRSTGTTDARVVRGMKRLVTRLKDERRWTLLEAVRTGRLTLATLYDADVAHRLDHLEAELRAVNLSGHLDGWIAWVRANRRAGVRTADVYWQQVTTLIPVGGRFLTSELTKARVTQWLAGLTCSAGTKRKYLAALMSFRRYLMDLDLLESDPIAGVTRPKKNPKRRRWVRDDVDQAIVQAALPEYRAFFAFIKATGADVGSAQRAQKGDLRLAQRRVTIRGTKTEHRHVEDAAIEPWAVPILAAHAKPIVGAATLLFPGITESGAAHHHKRCCTALGIADYTLKDARHAVAMRMRKAGRSFEEIAHQLGTSLAHVVSVYADVKQDEAGQVTATENG